MVFGSTGKEDTFLRWRVRAEGFDNKEENEKLITVGFQ